ncbi:MAG: histidinol dehydrogenase [Clostridiales bacterium]|nr:histidinol dehydrogenase [Clostridiales bacterium]
MIRILEFQSNKETIMNRTLGISGVEETVAAIIEDVKNNGDSALFRYCEKFDKARLDSLEVTQDEIDAAESCVDLGIIETMRSAAENIEAYHRKQVRTNFIVNERNGVVLGQKITPIEKVGLYIPGGTAAYPSTVLMNCIPAKIAGCKEIFIATPASGGTVNPLILAAAGLMGIRRIFKIGGAQAAAAMAFGTASVPKADKIFGPGNAYFTEAKRQLFGVVGIDIIAGPSEILIIADAASNPAHIAADMLSQAEHDVNARAILVTDSVSLARSVRQELENQIPLLPRSEIARASVDGCGMIVLTPSIRAALEIANEIAPEHLELCLDNPFDYLDSVRNAGSVFLGRYCPEVLGDYYAGPNHTLPTSGSARYSSPLSVDDFVKKTQFTYYTRDALCEAKDAVTRFAGIEGLHAHARSVSIRFEEGSL